MLGICLGPTKLWAVVDVWSAQDFRTFFLPVQVLAWSGGSEARSRFVKYVTDKPLEIALPS